MHPARALVTVLLPFALGYFLSYLFRTINAVVAPAMGAGLGLGAAELGLLTAAYFATFAVSQLPLGVALDRWGPRRVQLVLLPIAAAGALLFALAEDLPLLVLGRALIGLGVAAALLAGLKALVQWMPQERLALANGLLVMCGALGALAATAPADWLTGVLGWRALFLALALATLGAAAALWLVAPADPRPEARAPGVAAPGLGDVLRDARFWRVAPLSAGCIGTAFALQGLWAGPWLADVGGLDRADVVADLTLMALALCAGALALGLVTDRLRRRGVRPVHMLAVVALASMLAQLLLAVRAPVPDLLPWLWIAATGAGTVVSYAALAEVFPKALAGRANAALNLLHIGGAFAIQAGFGAVLDAWPAEAGGRYPAGAYAAALLLNLVPQALALLWFAGAPRLAGPSRLAGRPRVAG